MSRSRLASHFSAGAAVADLTPRESVFLFGYPHVPRHSTGVHDRLECAALYLRSGSEQVIFLANDLIFVPREVAEEVRRRVSAQTGVPGKAILLSATHTHSGPVTASQIGNAADPVVPPPSREYLAWITDQMVTAACRAHDTAVPAEAGLTVATASDVGSNRHDPAGPSDPAVPVLVARALDSHRPIACMLVYGMHPTVLHEDSTLISGDFPHFTRRYLQQKVFGVRGAADCPVLWHNGASGDQSPRHMTKENTFAEAQRLGENLARAVAAVLPAIGFRNDLTLRSRRTRVDLEPRQFPSVAAAQSNLDRVRSVYDELRHQQAPRQVVRTAECNVFGAEETAELARAASDGRLAATVQDYTPAEIQLIEVGPWRFVGWPGEFFVEYALALKAQAADTFLITMANGDLQGYIVTEEAAERGCYEASNALFSAANGPRFLAATLTLLQSSGTES